MVRYLGVAVGVLFLFVGGCAMEVADGAGDVEGAGVDGAGEVEGEMAPEAVGESSQALAGWASGPFTWSQGLGTRTLEPLSSHVCALTRMSGNFRGDGEWVQVANNGSRWTLGGGSQQSGVSGEATCYPRSAFTGRSATRAVGAYEVSTWARFDCRPNAKETGLGDTFVFLQGMQGQMSGGGEYGLVEQAPSPSTRSLLKTQTCVDHTALEAFALSYRVGTTGRMATFLNSGGDPGTMETVGEFEASGNSKVVMAPASSAMCAFTRIQGEFRGGGEAVQIRVEDGSWVLRTAQGGASELMRAHARCFSRDQRN